MQVVITAGPYYGGGGSGAPAVRQAPIGAGGAAGHVPQLPHGVLTDRWATDRAATRVTGPDRPPPGAEGGETRPAGRPGDHNTPCEVRQIV